MKNLSTLPFRILVAFVLLFQAAKLQAQFSTATLNGSIGAGEYGTHTDGNNQNTNSGVVTYMTWDASNLYIGTSGSTVGHPLVVYIDKDPHVPVNGGSNSNGTNVGQNYDGSSFAALQFRADIVMYAKNGYREYRTADGLNGWSSATANSGTSYFDNGNFSGGGVQELSMPWSLIGGLPSSFNFFCYRIDGSNAFVYGEQPTENNSGVIGTGAREQRYFTVSSTANGSATKPFSRNSYVFNLTASDNNFGSITVYDFTMNSSGLQISRGTNGGNWTINGSLVVAAGTVFFGSPNTGPFGTTTVANVKVNGGSLNMDQTNQKMDVTGNVELSSGSLYLSGNSGGNLEVAGSWTHSGGTFVHNNRTVTFDGSSGTQTVSGTSTFYDLTEANSGATLDFGSSTITVDHTFNVNSGTMAAGTSTFIFTGTGNIGGSGTKRFYNLQVNNGATITHSSGNIELSKDYTNNGTFTYSGSRTFTYTGGTTHALSGSGSSTFNSVTVQGSNTVNAGSHHFAVDGGTFSVSSGGTYNGGTAEVTFSGSCTMGSGAGSYNFYSVTITGTLNNSTNNKSFNVSGNWINNASYTHGSETITFNGSSPQSISGSSQTSFNSLTLNNAAGLTLSTTATVDGTLTFVSGIITTGSNMLSVPIGTLSGAGTGKYVYGKLNKVVPAGSGVSKTFEIGDAVAYAPVSLTFASVGTAGNITASTTPGDHPQIGSADIDPAKSANRYWSLDNSGTTFTTYDAVFNFVPGDVDGGANTAAFIVGKYDGAWTYPTVGTLTATSSQVTGVTSMSDFQAGEETCIPVTYYADADGDTYGDANDAGTSLCADPGAGYSTNNGDCNDGDAAINPGATEVCNGIDDDCDGNADDGLTFTTYYADADGDTYGDTNDAGTSLCADPGAGYSTTNDDCDDTNNAINPAATEVCNGIDDDCDGNADDGLTFTIYYADADGDTYGDSNDAGTSLCADPGAGYSTTNDDCDDTNSAINPAASEICNGIDDDCDGNADDGLTFTIYYVDADGDTYGDSNDPGTSLCADPGAGYSTNNGDCNDGDAAINPGATEVCNGIDDDCDGNADDGLTFTTYYVDADGDTYGDSNDPGTSLCADPGAGYSTSNGDCNDGDAAINPGATESCNGIDDDCDGNADDGLTFTTYYVDADGDTYGDSNDPGTSLCADPGAGYSTTNDDCDDTNNAINPAATEVCNGIDDDCNGNADDGLTFTTYYVDADGDTYGDSNDPGTSLCADPGAGYSTNNGDCNDGDAAINPGATESCNGIDDDCDGNADDGLTFTTYYVDADGDTYGDSNDAGTSLCADPGAGYSTTNDDCDDTNSAINPGATETCNGIDDNCDGLSDDNDPLVQGQSTYYVDGDGDGYGAGLAYLFCNDPGSGYSTSNTDCDDNDFYANPGNNTWYLDSDGDGYSNGIVELQCTRPPFYFAAAELISITGDCDDNNIAINPGATEVCNGIDDDCDGNADDDLTFTTYYVDADGDTYGDSNDPGTSLCADPGAGYSTNNGDCNDGDAAINPSATEVCNGIDDDCDGNADDGLTFTTYYVDADGDTYGDSNDAGTSLCADPGAGYSTNNGDCNDGDAAINPGATEVCNGIDDDCDGNADDGLTFTTYYVDADGDTYGDSNDPGTSLCADPGAGYSTNNGDCNDGDAAINPGATESCNGIDDDCDGNADDGLTFTTYYVDADGDTYGDSNDAGASLCADPGAGYSTTNDDCDDTNNAINPAATEVCNSIDDDCDGNADDGLTFTIYYVDADGDTYGDSNDPGTSLCADPGAGYSTNNGDCNDGDAAINPGATETCNGIDDDCDGNADDGLTFTTYYADADGDTYGDSNDAGASLCADPGAGYSTTNDDCDDTNNAINPAATEVCNGIDDDCDGNADDGLTFTTYYVDADGDTYGDSNDPGTSLCADPGAGYSTNNGDCNDGDAAINPGATESCNGIDDDCDGNADDGLTFTTYYVDADGDTYGDSNDPGTSLCADPGAGYSTNNGDCNDGDAAINPGATESCNGIDDDCDGNADDGLTFTTYYVDADGDTYGDSNDAGTSLCADPGAGYSTTNDDCDDTNSAINPAASEICNGIDDDCDGNADDGLTFTIYYVDADGDTYGDSNDPGTSLCADPGAGYSTTNDDCDDSNNAINPGSAELNNGIDDNCDGQVDEGYCDVPISISVDNIQFSTADVSWDPEPNAYAYKVRRKKTANDPTTYSYSIVYAPVAMKTLVELDDGENYQVEVQTFCDAGLTDSSGWSASVFFTTNQVCSKPNKPKTSGITATSANLSWQIVGSPDQYQVRYRVSSVSGWNVFSVPGTSNGTTLSGLVPSTSYDWKVRAKCGSLFSQYTKMKTFTTLAARGELSATDEHFTVYPNPTAANFVVRLDTGDPQTLAADIQLLDLMGRVVYSERSQPVDGVLLQEIRLDDSYSSGTYLVRVVTANQTFTQYLIYQK